MVLMAAQRSPGVDQRICLILLACFHNSGRTLRFQQLAPHTWDTVVWGHAHLQFITQSGEIIRYAATNHDNCPTRTIVNPTDSISELAKKTVMY